MLMGKVELRIEIDADLVDQAKAAGVTFDAAVEAGLRRAISQKPSPTDAKKAKAWAAENAEAIADHKQRIKDGGIFGEDFRTW